MSEFRDDGAPAPYADREEPAFRLEGEEESSDSMGAVLEDEGIPEDVVEKAPIWLITFGDVTALMLAFFVMLYSMSHLQSEKWDAVISILATRDDPVKPGEPTPVGERTVIRLDLVPAHSTGYLKRIMEQKLVEDPVLSELQMTLLQDQLILSLPISRYFLADGVTLNPLGEQVISGLSRIFRLFGNRLDIRGHTHPTPPVGGSPYGDNWALSLARALSVAKQLNAVGFNGDLTVLGLADSGYRHISRDFPEARRFDLAQRVDIVIVPEARGQ